MPIFLNFWPSFTPGVPGGTTNDACPRLLSSGSTEATTTCKQGTCVMPPLVIHVLVPLITHSSFASSYTARVRNDDTSEPASASLTQNAATCRSSSVPKHCGTHSPICSGVPLPRMPDTPSVVPRIASVMPASPHASSSEIIGNVMPVGSPNALAMKSSE